MTFIRKTLYVDEIDTCWFVSFPYLTLRLDLMKALLMCDHVTMALEGLKRKEHIGSLITSIRPSFNEYKWSLEVVD